MGILNGPSQRLDAGRIRTARRSLNAAPSRLYVSRAAASGRITESFQDGVDRLRTLARQGRLAAFAETAVGPERTELTGAAYAVAWPIVFQRLTRGFERRRGHLGCAAGVERLADDCLDKFHDDVEAVVDDLLTYARKPVLALEAWIASRLNAATINGHRRLRGQRGALQRPRLPGWLAGALGHDRWLTTLATEILVWVGVPTTAGSNVWPLDEWAQRRAAVTGDWSSCDPSAVARDVETVLAAMRGRSTWFESYVERPLGRKQAPVAAATDEESPLPLADPQQHIDAELLRLAADAVRAIDHQLTRGAAADRVVIDVIRAVFGSAVEVTGLDRAPYAVADPVGGLSGALADPATVNRIVKTVMDIIGR